ncbi:MAG: helix-turn-helix domain-containing protein [Alphaproteobacteria bacterium]|jgi:hypothetical protein|nr:helix-turn-helix domain-containing protein [Alphaproteobacteria bacterium]
MQPDTPFNFRLRTVDAAKYIGLSKSTLEKYRVAGGGPVYASLGRVVVYEHADLDEWVNARKRKSTSEKVFTSTDEKQKPRYGCNRTEASFANPPSLKERNMPDEDIVSQRE